MVLFNLTNVQRTSFNNAVFTKPVGFRGSDNLSVPQFREPEGYNDRFSTNPLYDNFKSKVEIEKIAKSNPRIMALLKENNIPLKVNIEVLESLKRGHLADTRVVAAKIYSALPAEMKSGINLEEIQQAAMLHDYGKVLIPKEILNKKGTFSPEEYKIMKLHSEFGYELLKEQGVSEGVLKLVKYHHQKPDGSGYPVIDDDFEYNISTQILEAADMYSALTEERPYHKASSKEEALKCIYKKVEEGVISQEVFEALEKACR